MRILVTGGAGYIGSHLVERLLAASHQVFVVDDFSTGSHANLETTELLRARGRGDLIVTKGDIRNRPINSIVPGMANIDLVYHLAAESRIGPSIKDPARAFSVNVEGMSLMLEQAVIRHNIPFVFASTSALQADAHLNPYAYTKALGEQMCQYVAGLNSKNRIAVLRIFNVYGGRQMSEGSHATVVGIFEKAFREGRPLTVTGQGAAIRDFIHVEDTVTAIVRAGQQAYHGEMGIAPIDVGTGKSYSILNVAKMFDPAQKRIEFIERRPGEASYTQANTASSRARLLGWEPSRTLEWYVQCVRDEVAANLEEAQSSDE